MLHYLKHLAKILVVVGVVATPAAAQEEPNGYPITDVNLRAGPGTEYPILVTVSTDAPVTILGCLEDYTWCDTLFEDQRGWMRSIYLAGYYDGEYYLLSDYAPDLGYQTVTFDVAAYWDAYYQDQPFYNDQYRVTEARGEGWVDEGVFYDRLAPHGAWTWTQGQYVWVPTGVDASWRPYTRGRWVYTDYGWTWVSYEPFGWATYHYGRWGYSDRIGWFWVPGNRWGPAWVYWQQSDDYLVWAPLPPAYSPGVSINISFGDIPAYYWSAVPSRYFLSDDLSRYYIHDYDRRRRLLEITRPIGHTTIVNNTVVNNVVNVNYVEQHTNEKVVEHKIARTRDFEEAGKVRGDAVEVYRPGLREGRGRSAPEKPRELEDIAKLSKTKGQARGAAATEEMLAPPEVREAIQKRRGGGPRGATLVEGKPSIEPEARSPRLPKGREAKGPPPSPKKATARPVPAHDLGTPQAAKQPAPGQAQQERPRGPQKKALPKQEAEPKQQAPGQAQQERPRGPERKASPKQEAEPKQKAPGQVQQERPRGPEKKAPPKQEAKPEQQGPSQAQQEKRRGPENKAPPRQEAKPEQQAPGQAQQEKPRGQEAKPEQQAPGQAQQEKPRGPEKKAPPRQEAKPKQQGSGQAQQEKPRGPEKKAPPRQEAKPEQQAPSQAQQEKPRGPEKKAPPKQEAKPEQQAPGQAQQEKPRGPDRKAPPKQEGAKKAPPKQEAEPKDEEAPPQAE